MKKTILYLRTDIINQELIAGGSISHTLGVIQGFADLGYSIICASSSMITILKSLSPISLLKQLKNPSFLSFFRWKINCLLSNIFFTYQVYQLLKKHEVGFIYQRYSILNCSGVLLSKLKNIPLVLEYNGSEAWVNKHWAPKKWFSFSWLISKIEQYVIKHAQHIVVVSEVLKDELVARGVSVTKILVNPNGVDTKKYNPTILHKERKQIRGNLSIEHTFVFGFISTFRQWHGINILEKIIPAIVQKKPEAHFLLIGDGILKEPLHKTLDQKKVLDHVTFTGILPLEKARGYLAACDAFLCPTQPNADGSRFFGSPTKLFEYMSLAKPVIASRLEQISDVINPAIHYNEQESSNFDHAVGFLVEAEKSEQFIAVSCLLIDLPNAIKEKMAGNARKHVLQYYSWKQHVHNIEVFIKEKGVI